MVPYVMNLYGAGLLVGIDPGVSGLGGEIATTWMRDNLDLYVQITNILQT